jgi:hypothetical protein
MKKLAIFVEGKTEQIFIDRFLREFIKKQKLSIISVEAFGKDCPRFTTIITEDITTLNTKYQVLIYNSCNDNRVISDLRERYENLKDEGYSNFIGIRDLYPHYLYNQRDEAIEESLFFLKDCINTKIIYATMEIETWFIAELNHYKYIHQDLTLEKIKNELIDLESIEDFEKDITEPAKKLNSIYQLVKNRHWTKSDKQIKRTVKALDYENLYLNITKDIPSLKELIVELDNFFIKETKQ